MEIKKYLILDEKGNHDYDIIVSETDQLKTYSLYHLNGNQWTEHTKGTLAMEMVDDGNGVKFNRKIKNLDYSTLTYVRLLVNIDNLTEEQDSYIAVRVDENETIKL